MTTSAPGRQMKLRPKISGCSVRTKTPTRQSGRPAWTSRSQVSDIIRVGPGADLAPSISQSFSLLQLGGVHNRAICGASSGHVKAIQMLCDLATSDNVWPNTD